MSEPMEVTVKVENYQLNGDEAASASAVGDSGPSLEPASQPTSDQPTESTSQATNDNDDIKEEPDDEEERARKRRASSAFSEEEKTEEFRGFDKGNLDDSAQDYTRVLERIKAEVTAAKETFTPVRNVVATPTPAGRASKRLRHDTGTDNSRPSSAMSSRSYDDGVLSSTDAAASSAASSPAHRGGRRPTTEMSSPLLRVPLDRGWRRELVYRAALDAHSRRNADIYYYTPNGKKLRSTREVSEHLSGTGLTIDNFSFFKEPLGVDDPDKEIIRDAKLMRRTESPVPAAPTIVEGKRTPKPKQPKGASPEPATPASPPLKIKVKLTSSRLSANSPSSANSAAKPPPAKKPAAAAAPAAGAGADNNNSTNWKKPIVAAPERLAQPPPPLRSRPPDPPPPAPQPQRYDQQAQRPVSPPAAQFAANAASPMQSPPPMMQSPPPMQSPPQVQQPCSIACGGGAVPSLACAACLCLYHTACVKHRPGTPFLCKNCKKSTSPPLEPPPLVHKSGVTAPVRAPVAPPRRPVLLTMKVSGSSAGGQRVWSVTRPPPPPPAPSAAAARALALRPTLPQSLANFNGKRFIVVPRSVAMPPHDAKPKRLSNGTAPASGVASPRRRGRARAPDTDYFTDFCNRSKEQNYNCVIQIFQYLGMRDLAHCARVCKQWRELTATASLWRHVRMKNSHVSDWSGLCSALKKHSTSRLDLRKMLLPQNDAEFWDAFAKHLPAVDTLERIEMCRCPASAVEAVCRGLPNLRSLSALAVRDARMDPTPLACLPHLTELRLKSMAGLSLTRDLQPLADLTRLQHLSLTSIKELGCCSCEIVGSLKQLVSLELGECTFRASFGLVLATLPRLQRLRLERGTAECAAPALLRALATLPRLHQLELVNFDVKVGFDDALAECKNIQRLLIIPTYVSQSATTNKQVLSGVLRLKDTLTHLMWGVTIELLRVTELFIDQCDQGGDTKKKDIGECIPVLKPVPGCRLPEEHHHVAGPPQVEILPLPTLQRLLSAQLPTTKLKLLRIPFHATWRQSLADFQ